MTGTPRIPLASSDQLCHNAVLRNWARPVLILQGSREMSFPVSLARKLHTALPASTLAEIPDAAHMAHFDNGQAWLAAIRSFLNTAR